MSCLGPAYNPQPTHVWYRVENKCTVILDAITAHDDALKAQMLYKGNVLKNKDNTTGHTQKQRYSQIAKAKWNLRKKSWATQSGETNYTNPNINNLPRIGNNLYQKCSGITCNLTSCSDVPGPSMYLCFSNINPQLNFVRKRYVMNNSGDKWPTNYKFSIAPQRI